MAGDFLKVLAGKVKEAAALVTSAGAGDAGRLVKLDSTGKLDTTLLPTGIGPEVASLATFENLTAGDFVNVFDDAGTAKARKADADGLVKRAHGFVLTGATAPAAVTVYFMGMNTQLSGMTRGAEQYLSQTAGARTETPPTGLDVILQRLGVAFSPTAMYFSGGDLVVEQIA